MKKRLPCIIVWDWLRKSFETKDGKASAQRLTIFIFTAMFFISWFMDLFYTRKLDPITLIIIGIVVLVGTAILKASDIVAILTNNRHINND